jgi:N-dimethylarginine dimethylaminohydrolase
VKEINIFEEEYNIALNPFALEGLWDLKSFFKDKIKYLKFNELKYLTIETLSFLLTNDLIYILEPNWMENKEFNKINISDDEIINKIKNNWTENISDDELYNLVWFKFQDWYRESLESKGLTVYTIKWNEFINEKIGDLEKWIEEHKPK